MRSPSAIALFTFLAFTATGWFAAAPLSQAHARAQLLNIGDEDVSENVGTAAQTCTTCRDAALGRSAPAQLKKVKLPVAPAEGATSFDVNTGLTVWARAIQGRHRAKFLGGGWREGNRSKGKCAEAVKDALLDQGICQTRPAYDNAYALQGAGALVRSCNRVQIVPGRESYRRGRRVPNSYKVDALNIANAPKNAIIIYSGYAGSRPHEYGHVERKILMTAELKQKINSTPARLRKGRGHEVTNVPIGSYIYCSDFCRSAPLHTKNNPVAAIYEVI